MFQKSFHNPEEPNEAALDEVLRKARLEVPLVGTFQADVWRRIAVRQKSSMPLQFVKWMEKIFGALVRPMPAAATLFFMISAGVWFGAKG